RAAVEGLAALLLRTHLDDVATALRAGHAERDRARVLARGIPRAREELAVPPAADDHGLSALVAIDARIARLRPALAVRAEVARVLALRVVRAAEEPAVLRPALHHLPEGQLTKLRILALRSADLAHLARGLGLGVPALALLALVELLAELLV